MANFSLIIEYLTGYAVATDPSSREEPEWPPHAARVFMALAAAHFETDDTPAHKDSERDALNWLSELDPPDVTVPEATRRDALTTYVPVNDQNAGEALLRRSRQPRLFPRVYVGAEPLLQTWRIESNGNTDRHLAALESLCRKVTRIGHSSSLVWMRLERDTAVSPTHVPDDHALDRGQRIVFPGSLKRLEDAFNKSAVDAFAALGEQIASAKGKAKKDLQKTRDEAFPRGEPTSQRPTFSIRRGYRPESAATAGPTPSLWDPNFIVLTEAEDSPQSIGLESTAQVTAALRNLIMSRSTVQPVPPWIGGHEANGEKLQSGQHIALIPLAFVDSKYADGHLLGMGILFPREVPLRERAKVFSPILFDGSTNEPVPLTLTMGTAGVWKVVRETSLLPKLNLRTTTYTRPSRKWASVTPVILDRMPKADRVEQPVDWRGEVAKILALSCANVGLPQPIAVRVEKTPFFLGSLRAMPGQGGFPRLRSDRYQVHVELEFEDEVEGPVLLGAGRFRGYGLMRPSKSGETT